MRSLVQTEHPVRYGSSEKWQHKGEIISKKNKSFSGILTTSVQSLNLTFRIGQIWG